MLLGCYDPEYLVQNVNETFAQKMQRIKNEDRNKVGNIVITKYQASLNRKKLNVPKCYNKLVLKVV